MSECLFDLPSQKVQTRWASWENPDAAPGAAGRANGGRKGSPCISGIAPGETFVLAHAEGMGMVRRLWTAISEPDPQMMRGLVLRFYWDGNDKPAVEVPMGDFFCLPLGQMAAFENAWFDSGEGRSFNCRVPMPFYKGFKITVTNESPARLSLLYYDVNFTVGDELKEAGYFHACWRRENPTTLRRDFEILPPTCGRGRFLGCNLGVIADKSRYGDIWWGEGEVKIYLDGDDALPTLCGTGTEDYIGSAYGQGQFARQWHGCPYADEKQFHYGFYRLHGPDPVYFHQSIRAAIQQIGYASTKDLLSLMETGCIQDLPVTDDGGKTITLEQLRAEEPRWHLFERQDDWCATSYLYLDQPTNTFPRLAPYEERIAGLSGERKE